MIETDSFLDAYIEAALWSTNDESTPQGGEPFDANYSAEDLAEESRAEMRADCEKFLAAAEDHLARAEELDADGEWSLPGGVECSIREYAGHDFWLTRNGHGCGFWDGDWPDGIGEALDALAEEFGDCGLHLGDDGKIYTT